VQFGFREGRSTVDAILTMEHAILRGFELCERKKEPTNVCAVFFDVSKAFDTVPFPKLLKNLQLDFSLPTTLLATLKDYLTQRKMRVKVGKEYSSCSSIESGVVQGSAIGPVLFTAYINRVAKLELHEKSRIILYADDIVLLHPPPR
jgi:retron-type reverse transcriptase